MTCKIVPNMTYNVFGETLNLAQSIKTLNYKVGGRAVLIELFTARVLCRASSHVLEYSTDSGSGY